MQLEQLEDRRLCSVTVTETSAGFYEVVGDDSDNQIIINVSQDEQSFTLDGVTYTGVDYIYVFGLGGNDAIDVSALYAGSIAASIDGGDGADHLSLNFDGGIWGGEGDDVIDLANSFRGEVSGDGGDDQVFVSGDCVNAEILGGDGNDLIDASANNYGVLIRGGGGDDVIYGSEYNDRICGDDGADRLFGKGGNDTFYCADGSADDVDGGDGTNFMHGDYVEGQVLNIAYVFYG